MGQTGRIQYRIPDEPSHGETVVMPISRINLTLLSFLLITTLSACYAPEPESATEVNANYNVELISPS